MKIFHWFISAVGLVILLALFITGCTKTPENTKYKEIEFWTLQLSDFAPYINGVITGYEKIHPDVKIKWIDVPFSEGEKRALAAVMSNRVPDLINMNPSFGSTLASRGVLIDLKKYVNKEDYNKYLAESWDASTLGNITFGVPWYITSSITIYNAEILKRAGLNPDNSPKTYDELGNISKIIKDKTGKYAFMPNLTEDGQLIKIFNKYNIPIVNKERTKALFNTPKAVQVLTFWTDLYNNKLIPPESLTQGHRVSLEQYQAGANAFIFTGANFLRMIKDNAPKIYNVTRVAPQISGSSGKVDFALMNLVVPTKSKYPKEAVDFALFLTNNENQLAFCKLAPILPSTLKAINSDYFKNKNTADIIDKARSLSATQLNNALKPIPPLENQKDLFEIADYATQQALLNQTKPKQALDQAIQDWNKILKSQ
ncbi:MAG: sugar ABC transporter substrate-binding protein [Candidatus Gastranaerophilales bacterium]|nr:sugar ABC transporter substrate-binding protein [Candidatus Gastranaerophilales bacterium]